MPPYLAGRDDEIEEFKRLLNQREILENLILTGLRGVGKTVLLETFKPLAIQSKWLWVGTDLSESASISESSLAIRIMTDLAVVTSKVFFDRAVTTRIGFGSTLSIQNTTLGYDTLARIYESTPGLVVDKLKNVLETAWSALTKHKVAGLIFAYDEAQTMFDSPGQQQYPLSLLLDLFQSIQKKGIPLMLVLVGLPTLFPKLVETRTFSERMFHVVTLTRLARGACRDAICKPIEQAECPLRLTDESIDTIIEDSGGYPYFIQFICREVYDTFSQKIGLGKAPQVPREEIMRKLDADFFAGRWTRVTDRQRDLLSVIAQLERNNDEFTVQEIVENSKSFLAQPFSSSHVNQMLSTLCEQGLVYKNRHGKYSLAVPLFAEFILRQLDAPSQ